MERYKMGWVRDNYDPRDFRLEAPTPAAVVAKAGSLRAAMPPVYDQGPLGSCTYNAIGGVLHYDQLRQKVALPLAPSRLFGYWNERYLEGTTYQDAGAMIRDGIKATMLWGWCDERIWPYIPARFAVRPPATVYQAARPHRIQQYARVPQTGAAIKAQLAAGNPVVFGFSVFQSIYATKADGRIAAPQPNDRPIGGHAVVIVGWNDDTGLYEIRNSWNTTWGDQGYGFLPYSYVEAPQLASDFWTILFTP